MVAVDASPTMLAAVREADPELETHLADAADLPFDDGAFDLLLATDVLEHVARDDVAASELRRVAAPGALLVVTVPAYRWLWSQHDDSHHHLRRYSAPALRERLAEGGWRTVLLTYFNALLLPPIALVRLTARRRRRTDYELTEGPLNRVLELPMRAEAALIERGWRFPAGVSIGAVCTPR
jgi:SAM-dependent methyltransferase